MTILEREIRTNILTGLLAARGNPLTDGDIKRHIRNSHPGLAFSDADLNGHIRDAEDLKLIAGTDDDEIFGLVWALTPKGKIRAQEVR